LEGLAITAMEIATQTASASDKITAAVNQASDVISAAIVKASADNSRAVVRASNNLLILGAIGLCYLVLKDVRTWWCTRGERGWPLGACVPLLYAMRSITC
jgi:hypothetical protein